MTYPMTFTAIPHEIGHVVYRFGQFPLARGKLPIHRLLRNRLLAPPYNLNADDWRFQWLEEIFADAYGCLVAGPVSVLGFQMMLADGPPQHLREHLGDHPFPVLRPLIQSQILRSIRTQYNNPIFSGAPELLDARWQNWVVGNWQNWVYEKWLGYTDQTDIVRDASFKVAKQTKETMTGQEILNALQPVIAVVLLTLERVRPESAKSTWTPEWEPSHDTEQLDGLYRNFVEFSSDVASKALAAPQASFQYAENVAQGNQTLIDLLDQFEGNDTHGWQARSGGIDGLIEMILFDSWSVEGPEGQHEQ